MDAICTGNPVDRRCERGTPPTRASFLCGATQNSLYIFDVSHLIRYAPHLLRGRWKLLGVYMPECTPVILWMHAAGAHLFVPGIL